MAKDFHTETHFVARLVIEKVTKTTLLQYNQTKPQPGDESTRDKEEIATVVTKAADLTTLTGKLDHHIRAELSMNEVD